MEPITEEAKRILFKMIKDNKLSDEEIKKRINNGLISVEELLEKQVLTQVRLDQILRIDYLANIRAGKYNADEIASLIYQGKVAESDVEKILGQDTMDVVMNRPAKPFILMVDWSQIPPEKKPHRTDVFVLGTSGAGKSAFLAGILHYGDSEGRLLLNTFSALGFVYGHQLINSIRDGQLPPPTPEQQIQYLECDFFDKEKRSHPLNILEMSGEIFKGMYKDLTEVGQKDNEKKKDFDKHLRGQNHKILFFTIDFKAHTINSRTTKTKQFAHFDHAIQYFEQSGILKTTEAICILITKWDANGESGLDAATEFLKKEYRSFIFRIEQLKATYSFKLLILPFSLGTFDDRDNYTFAKESGSASVFEWMCSVSPSKKK